MAPTNIRLKFQIFQYKSLNSSNDPRRRHAMYQKTQKKARHVSKKVIVLDEILNFVVQKTSYISDHLGVEIFNATFIKINIKKG
jgi:hypothetical protein